MLLSWKLFLEDYLCALVIHTQFILENSPYSENMGNSYCINVKWKNIVLIFPVYAVYVKTYVVNVCIDGGGRVSIHKLNEQICFSNFEITLNYNNR